MGQRAGCEEACADISLVTGAACQRFARTYGISRTPADSGGIPPGANAREGCSAATTNKFPIAPLGRAARTARAPRNRARTVRAGNPMARRQPRALPRRSALRTAWHRCAMTGQNQLDQRRQSRREGSCNPREPLQSRETQGRVSGALWGSNPFSRSTSFRVSSPLRGSDRFAVSGFSGSRGSPLTLRVLGPAQQRIPSPAR